MKLPAQHNSGQDKSKAVLDLVYRAGPDSGGSPTTGEAASANLSEPFPVGARGRPPGGACVTVGEPPVELIWVARLGMVKGGFREHDI